MERPSQNIEIIEQFCQSKTGRAEECEDIVVANEHFIAVIDGATSKTGMRHESKTGGRIAAELTAAYLNSAKLAADVDFRTATGVLQAELQAFAKAHLLEEKGVHLCASAVIYSIAKRQIWAIGDCQFLINGRHHTFYKKVDTILAEARSLAIHALLQSGHSEAELMEEDLGRKCIHELLSLQKHLENSDNEYGYSVLSGTSDVRDVIVTDVPHGAEVVLASDGYPELWTTLTMSEARLREQLLSDPLSYKTHKSTKGLTDKYAFFDDRSYIRFMVKD